MASKFYTREKMIRGKKYVAQFNGLSEALRAVDESYIDNSSNTSTVKISNYVLENVIVEPKGLTIDDFDDMDELNEVIAFGRDVMQGKFRESDKKTGEKSRAEKVEPVEARA
jgi:hypothetical protein